MILARMTMSNPEAIMKKKWYVYEMNRHKDRIKPETKARMKQEFEDSVLAYASYIEHGRWENKVMNEFRSL
jgi:hypothetical protein